MTERTDPFSILTLAQLRERGSAKWRHYPADVLPLWVAEMDVPLAPPIADALTRLVTFGDAGYPGDEPYREAFASFATDSWGWDPSVARTRAAASVIAAYADALFESVGAGGAVVVTSPVYPPFYSYLAQAGLTVVEAPLTADLRLDQSTLGAAFAEATSAPDGGKRRAALLLCNPHNPGGTVHTKAELEEMAGDKIPLSAIKTIAEVVEDPHIAARNMIVDVPIAGKLIGMFGLPIKLSGAGQMSFEKAPLPGEDNAEVLSRLADVTAAELARLKASGAI